MEIKFQVSEDGTGYVAVVDPSSKEHRKAVNVAAGQEVSIDVPTIDNEADINLGEPTPMGSDAPAETPQETPPEGGGDGGDGGEGGPAAGSDQGQQQAGGETPPEGGQPPTPEPTTSEASEKPLYVVDGDTVPEGFALSGLETPDGKTLYHFANDTAGQSATGNVDGVSVYADADDNEQPVKAETPQSAEGQEQAAS